MSTIKQNIMDSAVRFFSEKGYISTSIQDIADDCGIAKGSLYKYFPSKEELFIEVHQSRQNKLFAEIDQIRADQTLSLREVFIRETESQFNFFILNKFIVRDIIELNTTEGKINTFLLQLRANLLNMNRDAVTRRFGKEIEPHIWDLVMIYSGISHEYLFLLIFEKSPLNVRDVSVFIVDHFEYVVASVLHKKPQPLLHYNLMNKFIDSTCVGKPISIVEHRNLLFDTLFSIVKELTITNHRKTELMEALIIVQKEVEQDQPKSVLISAMLQFLEKEHELRGTIRQLEMLVFRN